MSKRFSRVLTFLFLTVICMTMTGQKVSASVYGHSVGIRLGNHFAADYKFYMGRHSAMDFTFGLINPFTPRYQFLLVSAAYHFQIATGVSRLNPYFGAGLSTGARFGDVDPNLRDRVDYFLSVDIPIGLEYTLARKPASFFIEWSPKLQVVKDVRFIPQSVSVGVRFIFKKNGSRFK